MCIADLECSLVAMKFGCRGPCLTILTHEACKGDKAQRDSKLGSKHSALGASIKTFY